MHEKSETRSVQAAVTVLQGMSLEKSDSPEGQLADLVHFCLEETVKLQARVVVLEAEIKKLSTSGA